MFRPALTSLARTSRQPAHSCILRPRVYGGSTACPERGCIRCSPEIFRVGQRGSLPHRRFQPCGPGSLAPATLSVGLFQKHSTCFDLRRPSKSRRKILPDRPNAGRRNPGLFFASPNRNNRPRAVLVGHMGGIDQAIDVIRSNGRAHLPFEIRLSVFRVKFRCHPVSCAANEHVNSFQDLQNLDLRYCVPLDNIGMTERHIPFRVLSRQPGDMWTPNILGRAGTTR